MIENLVLKNEGANVLSVKSKLEEIISSYSKHGNFQKVYTKYILSGIEGKKLLTFHLSHEDESAISTEINEPFFINEPSFDPELNEKSLKKSSMKL